jgi:hypothetical protein
VDHPAEAQRELPVDCSHSERVAMAAAQSAFLLDSLALLA